MDDTGQAPGAKERVFDPLHGHSERRHRVRLGGQLAEDEIRHDADGGGKGIGREVDLVSRDGPRGLGRTRTPQTNARQLLSRADHSWR